MTFRIIGALLAFAFISCKDVRTNYFPHTENVADVPDSIRLYEDNLWIKFNDHGLFDTTFFFEQYFGFCGFGADLSKNFIQPRFSNKKFNNRDSSRFEYEPFDDSLLFLNFYWQNIDSTENISFGQLNSKLKGENISRLATRRTPYSKSLIHKVQVFGLTVGIFGVESAFENGLVSFSKLEVFTIFDSIKITAHFQYSGAGNHKYLNDFMEVAKTMRIKK